MRLPVLFVLCLSVSLVAGIRTVHPTHYDAEHVKRLREYRTPAQDNGSELHKVKEAKDWPVERRWAMWKEKYGRTYKDKDEEKIRFDIWKERDATILRYIEEAKGLAGYDHGFDSDFSKRELEEL